MCAVFHLNAIYIWIYLIAGWVWGPCGSSVFAGEYFTAWCAHACMLLFMYSFLAVSSYLNATSSIRVFGHGCVWYSSSLPKAPLKGATRQKVIHVQFHRVQSWFLSPFYSYPYRVRKKKKRRKKYHNELLFKYYISAGKKRVFISG